MIDKEMNFLGSVGRETDKGCEKKDCPMSEGGQGYLGELNCGPDDIVKEYEYDAAAKTPLRIGYVNP